MMVHDLTEKLEFEKRRNQGLVQTEKARNTNANIWFS